MEVLISQKSIGLLKKISFDFSDDDFDPICLRGNYWELVKEDIEMALEQFKKVDS